MTSSTLAPQNPLRRNRARLVLLLGFASLLAALGLYAAQHWLRTAPFTAADLEAQQQRVTVTESLLRHAEGATVPLVQLLVAADREMRVPLYKQIDAANAGAEADLAALALLTKSAEEKSRLDELLALRARYDERYTAAVEELELGGTQGVLSQFWAPTREALVAMAQASRRLAEQERATLATQRMTLEGFGAETQRLGWAVLAAVVAALGLGAMGASLLLRRDAA